ncbi:hypothetical protein BESB_055920 [Besnoitia besnoiti]|uniref:Uncharacterized protein n=1 Tax=Besnoitia besnoiti TaxID=94643 RepID=A0A2A9MI61_BESBE|nr:hypothetical protein BESB_055920 [Besnoitia besnoiti]PFH35941.1 hypothetical protein BESB_055920 [Besnoitia besnoiti]
MAADNSDVPEAFEDAAGDSTRQVPGSLPYERQRPPAPADVKQNPALSSLRMPDTLIREDMQENPRTATSAWVSRALSESTVQKGGSGGWGATPWLQKCRDGNVVVPAEPRRRAKELLQAKKARKIKHFSKITFTNPDPSYYNLLPVQPAVGWWKSVLTRPKHSLAFLRRMASNLHVAIPDTVFCSSTDCFYISSLPQRLEGTTDEGGRKPGLPNGEHGATGWIICSDFSAAKLLENKLASRLQTEGQESPAWEASSHNVVSSQRCSFSGSLSDQSSGTATRERERASFAGSRIQQPPAGALPQAKRDSPPLYPAAVMKQMHYIRRDCNITKALDLATFGSMSSDSSLERVYQEFVRGKPRSRCQLTRVCWSALRAPSGFTLVNRLTPQRARHLGGDLTSQFCVSGDNPPLNGVSKTAEEEHRRNADPAEKSFDVFPVAGATLSAAAQVAKTIFHFTQNVFRLWLETIVVDLVKGPPHRTWYFLQVKSFTIRQAAPTAPISLPSATEADDECDDEPGGRRKQKACDDIRRSAIPSLCYMCGLTHRKKDLTKTVNLRMMLETQHHMRKRGLDIFFFPVSGRLQLSSNRPICSLCYSLYLAERELIQVELDLAQALRQPMPHRDPAFFSFTGVLDAIQSSSQANDPYLIDLMRSFNNAPPRQLAPLPEDEEGGDAARANLDLQQDCGKERDAFVAFVSANTERPGGEAEPPGARGLPSKSITPCADPAPAPRPDAGPAAVAARPRPTAASGAVSELPDAKQPCVPRPRDPATLPGLFAHAGGAPPAAGGAASSQKAPRRDTPPGCRRTARQRRFTGGSGAVAPPKQTLRGGEAVSSCWKAKGEDDRGLQLPPKLYQWRMMLFVHSLQDLPSHLLPFEQEDASSGDAGPAPEGSTGFRGPTASQLAIELELFGSTTTLPLTTPDRKPDFAPGDEPRRRGGGYPPASAEWANERSPGTGADGAGGRAQPGASLQYIPVKRFLVIYLFSVSPRLHKIFQQETIRFRLLSSASARPWTPAHSASLGSSSSLSAGRLHHSRLMPAVISACLTCSRACCGEAAADGTPSSRGAVDFRPASRLTAAEIIGRRPYSAATTKRAGRLCQTCGCDGACGGRADPPADTPAETCRPRSRPQTAASAPVGRHEKCGLAALRGRPSAGSPAPAEPAAGLLREVATGSCSLARLAGVKHSKQQTYVLLFAKPRGRGQARLRLALGLHQDMQVPSQYVCARAYADALLPARPYSSPCPLPAEWLDCLAGSAVGEDGAPGGARAPAAHEPPEKEGRAELALRPDMQSQPNSAVFHPVRRRGGGVAGGGGLRDR